MRSTLTLLCQLGMKSALWRTRSKIFCSWGLMKELSRKQKVRTCQSKDLGVPLTVTAPGHMLRLCCFFSTDLEYWASVLFWVRLLGLCTECWLFSPRWPRTGEESLTEHPCLEKKSRHRNEISSDPKKGRFNVKAHCFVKAVPNVNT